MIFQIQHAKFSFIFMCVSPLPAKISYHVWLLICLHRCLCQNWSCEILVTLCLQKREIRLWNRAELQYARGDAKHEAASNYADTANCFRKVNPQLAIDCLLKTAEIYTDMVRMTGGFFSWYGVQNFSFGPTRESFFQFSYFQDQYCLLNLLMMKNSSKNYSWNSILISN